MANNLFVVEPSASHIMPTCFDKASLLATRIIRSEFHKGKLCGLFQNNNMDHISMADLTQLVNKNEIFVVDKIRSLAYLGARACVKQEYDPSKVYLNPLMLLEMQDRERELEEIQASGSWEDLFGNLPSNLFNESGKPIRKHHNALVYCQQKQAATMAAGPPPAKKAKSVSSGTLIPSSLNIVEKDTLMLAFMLVHEGDHLLNSLFSTVVKSNKGRTPGKKMSIEHDKHFTDVGHMMERELYGFVIQHGFDDALPAPFAIHEILGSLHMVSSYDKYILDVTPSLKHLLTDPVDSSIDIKQTVLAMHVTSMTPFQQHSEPCIIPSTSMNASDCGEGPSTSLREEEGEEEEDKEEDFGPLSKGIV